MYFLLFRAYLVVYNVATRGRLILFEAETLQLGKGREANEAVKRTRVGGEEHINGQRSCDKTVAEVFVRDNRCLLRVEGTVEDDLILI